MATINKDTVQLKTRVTNIEKNIKKNNLILWGLQEDKTETSEMISNKIKNLVKEKLKLHDSKIIGTYRFGKPNKKHPRPIRIKLKHENEKYKILSNSKLLKGTSISFNEDLPRDIVEDRKILHQAKLQAAKENKQTRLKGDKLFIDTIPYIVRNKKLTMLNQS